MAVFGLTSPKLYRPAVGRAVYRSNAMVSLMHKQMLGFMLEGVTFENSD